MKITVIFRVSLFFCVCVSNLPSRILCNRLINAAVWITGRSFRVFKIGGCELTRRTPPRWREPEQTGSSTRLCLTGVEISSLDIYSQRPHLHFLSYRFSLIVPLCIKEIYAWRYKNEDVNSLFSLTVFNLSSQWITRPVTGWYLSLMTEY